MDRDEAIDILRYQIPSEENMSDKNRPVYEALQTLIPELRESEDERIRKGLIELIKNWNYPQELFTTKRNIIVYLEKQKEEDVCPEYCVKSHCLGCPIYEKQKKQLIPLMNGDADAYFDEWRCQREHAPTRRECFEEGMRYSERLLSEYTPLVKEEDYSGMDDVEKAIHRGFLAAQVRNVPRVIIEETAKEVRGILQKEQKPIELSDKFEIALEEFLMNADASEKTFAEDVKDYADKLREIVRQEQKPLTPEEKVKHPLYVEGFEAGKEVGRQYEKTVGGQKPRKFKVGDKVHLDGDKINILTITGIEEDRYLTDCAYGPILFCAEDIWERVEQKPAEWSEKHIADIFEKVGLAKIVREQGNDELTNALQAAMLELSKVENTEWSEEDENCIRNLESVIYYDKNLPTDTRIKLGDFLKSLRPQQKVEYKWTKEDEDCLSTIIWCFEKFAEGLATVSIRPGDAKAYLKVVKNWKPDNLKSFRPSWKPSEEDIMMLKHIIGQYETENKNSKAMGYLPRIEELDFLKKTLARWEN